PRFSRRTALAAPLALFARSTFAADYPARAIKLIVPYAPGGGADAVARIVGKRVGEGLGQPIVIENKGGAGSIVGTEMVAKAEPDGYTLLLGQSGPISINPAVYRSLPYDPLKDFAPISMTTAYPYILVVNADLPAKTLQEFVALAKARPGAMNYGSTGVGAANHLVSELFDSKAGIKMTHVPYRGTALAVVDLVSGHLSMVFGDPVSVLPPLRASKLRALAVTSRERSPIAPDVPTIAESGYPGFDVVAWHGILAPAKTPPPIVDLLHGQIAQTLREPEIQALLANQAMQPVGNSPAAFAAFIRKDIALWKEVAASANVSVE
ncbi:MAG: tripartite tricarboxylate transporter substrate binding protein, partial [Alphaproteobacteria bacterium]|nr:tripartite tricarboxylate transporter substrate binding protein [Alphaproteobacteria bacterium]